MSTHTLPLLTTHERQAIDVFLKTLYQRYPALALQATLFGSKARGDSSHYSDIDVLIIVEEESWPLRRKIVTLAAEISLGYDVLLSPRIIGRERWERMKRGQFSLYRTITAEGITLDT